MAAFVGLVQASLATETSQANKRAKTGTTPARSNRLADLITLLEYVDTNKIEASFPLLALCLEVLAACVELQASNQLDTSYAAQVLVATIQNLTLRLAKVADPSVEGIRVSPVLELIRISNNPQTSSQALSLIADLAAIVPEQVVQNVMPIFTFMGTNLMQRDDISSSRLVDKVCPNPLGL